MSILIPGWFKRLDAHDPVDIRLRNKYFIKSAALIHSPEGTVEELAAALDVSTTALIHAYSRERGKISPEMATRLEGIMGPGVLPRKLLRPDVFF